MFYSSSSSSNQVGGWFAPAINESLAFYMSTNTFSNPMFEAQHFEPDSSQEEEEEENNANIMEQSQVGIGQDVNNNSISSRTINGGANNNKNTYKKQHINWTNFCDNLMFSIKSKIYVLELNFKRKLQRLRRYASGHLPTWLITNLDVIGKSGSGSGSIRPQSAYMGSRESSNFHYMMDQDQFDETEENKFWENMRQPYSKDSLNVQQEKILSRLEQVIQAKRSNSFYGFLNQQQQEGELFNIAQSELDARMHLNNNCSSTSSHDSEINCGKSGTKFRAGFNKVLNTTGICSPKLKDKQQQQQLRRTTRGRQRVRNKWISRHTQGKRQAVYDLSSTPEVTYFDENDDDDQTKKLCIVCYTNQANIVTIPCKHHNTCSDCFIEIIYLAVKNSRYPLKCVLCRQKIESIRCSRQLLLSVIEKNRSQQ